jgi:hypothetical protein
MNKMLSPYSMLDGALLLLLWHPAKYVHDHREEYWGKKDSKKGHPGHSSEDSCTQRLIHFRPRAFSNHLWQHPENESKRGHEDWAQTQYRLGRKNHTP